MKDAEIILADASTITQRLAERNESNDERIFFHPHLVSMAQTVTTPQKLVSSIMFASLECSQSLSGRDYDVVGQMESLAEAMLRNKEDKIIFRAHWHDLRDFLLEHVPYRHRTHTVVQ